MDGLAAGVSLIACVFQGLAFLCNGQMAAAVLPALLGGALLAFLLFNFAPASIFMGDCGSMFLGLMLAGTPLLSDYRRTPNLDVVWLAPVLIMVLPICDTCIVMVTRALSGRPIVQGGCDHVSHRLVALGMSERRAVLHLYSVATCSGVLALLVHGLHADVIGLLVPSFALIVLGAGVYLGKVPVSPQADAEATRGPLRG